MIIIMNIAILFLKNFVKFRVGMYGWDPAKLLLHWQTHCQHNMQVLVGTIGENLCLETMLPCWSTVSCKIFA